MSHRAGRSHTGNVESVSDPQCTIDSRFRVNSDSVKYLHTEVLLVNQERDFGAPQDDARCAGLFNQIFRDRQPATQLIGQQALSSRQFPGFLNQNESEWNIFSKIPLGANRSLQVIVELSEYYAADAPSSL